MADVREIESESGKITVASSSSDDGVHKCKLPTIAFLMENKVPSGALFTCKDCGKNWVARIPRSVWSVKKTEAEKAAAKAKRAAAKKKKEEEAAAAAAAGKK